MPTWIANPVLELFNRHLGPNWLDSHDDPAFWDRLLDVPDADLWAARQALRADLFVFMRERLRLRWTTERVSPPLIVSAGAMLDPDALTIGYARRFTAYKRPELIFHDAERLAKILGGDGRPVQIVFAGKAHPADDPAKHHLQQIFRHALDPMFLGRIAFIDDYDMHVAHCLVAGCDVWLNNPRKPLEASGTSGMKASINGVPHLSIGDGWWAEGFNGQNGWLIESHANPDDHQATDAADARVALHAARGTGGAGVLRARRASDSAALAASGARSDAHEPAAVLSPADGQAVCNRDVRAGSRGDGAAKVATEDAGIGQRKRRSRRAHTSQVLRIQRRR